MAQPIKILVVEDEAVIARDLRTTLQDLGYAVPVPVGSSERALEAIAADPPDLVLMDIRIRGAMDGIQTAARVRETHDVPVIFLTSHSDEATIARASATSAYGFVFKPFSDKVLRAAIEAALKKHAEEKSAAG